MHCYFVFAWNAPFEQDEEARWQYFFDAGISGWLDDIEGLTFSTRACELTPSEAVAIVDHWKARRAILANTAPGQGQSSPEVAEDELMGAFCEAMASLSPLCARLDAVVQAASQSSSTQQAFVKLSTRSPKDSAKALARAGDAYRLRLKRALLLQGGAEPDENARWTMLAEEVAKAGAVSSRGGCQLPY